MRTLPGDAIPHADSTWLFWYGLGLAAAVLVALMVRDWRNDRKPKADPDMRRHVNRTDTYLDPQGWRQ